MSSDLAITILDPSVTFLNHGSFGATPKPVYREYQRWQREMEKQPVEFLGRRITQLLANSRAELGKYLGTSIEESLDVTRIYSVADHPRRYAADSARASSK